MTTDPLASQAELYTGPEFEDAFAVPETRPGKAQVLLIGDSISIGYTVFVRRLLHDRADVHRIPGNAQAVDHGLAMIDSWLGDRHWDLIHFNWGLWDICYRHPESTAQGHRDKVNGTISTRPDDYRAGLTRLVERLQQTGAKLIWCATTPVPENEVGRIVGDEVRYNAIAAEIMSTHGIAISDLHTHAFARLPDIGKAPGDVHFTGEGSAYLAEQVAAAIGAFL